MSEASSATPKATPKRTRKSGPVDYEVYRVGQGSLQVVTMSLESGMTGTVVTAANDIEAIKAAHDGPPPPGQYVGIPLRFLRVRTVEHINDPKVVIS